MKIEQIFSNYEFVHNNYLIMNENRINRNTVSNLITRDNFN